MMNQDERGRVAVIIDQMAQYYGRKYDRSVISMMIDDLQDMPLESVLNAFSKYRQDPKSRVMPLPAQIRDIIEPTVNPDAKAREIAGRVSHAVTRFGWNNPEKAMEYVGTEGWELVRGSGGWNYICENLGITLQPGTFIAQIRDRLKDRFQYGAQAIHDQIEQRPKVDQLQIEAANQRIRLEQWQIEDIEKNKKPDPNEDYVAKTPEERDAIVRKFLDNLRAKEMP